MRNKNAIQHLLSSHKEIANLQQYSSNPANLGWPSGWAIRVDAISDRDLIDRALALLNGKEIAKAGEIAAASVASASSAADPVVEREFGDLDIGHQIRAAEFLNNITGRYIEAVRHAEAGEGNPNRDVLWGGDIELGAIANVLNLRITVYRPAVVEGGDLQNDHPVGPVGGRQINLWYEHGHYENYEPKTGQHTNNVLGGGNCLFYAVLRAVYQLEDHDEEYGFTTDAVRDLRERITGNLRARIAELDPENPIRIRFAMIFRANNVRQLQYAIAYLPAGRLRDEAINLLPENRRSLLSRGVELPEFTLGLFDSINMPSGSYTFLQRAMEAILLFSMYSLSPYTK